MRNDRACIASAVILGRGQERPPGIQQHLAADREISLGIGRNEAKGGAWGMNGSRAK